MRHIALITTSYPENSPGSEAAGSFVEDFARELSRHVRVTVLAASTIDSRSGDDRLSVCRFAVPRLPLSLLNPVVPTHWMPILKSIRAGETALARLVKDDRPDHILALWVLPSGYWAERVASRYGMTYSVWALGSDIWVLGKVPLVRRVLIRVLQRANRRYADGLQLANDVEDLSGQRCDFLPSTRLLPEASRDASVENSGCRLAFLGRWHRNKGVDLLLDALGHLTEKDWSRISEVRIHGGGPLNDWVRKSIRQLIDQHRPVFVGGYLDKAAAATLIAWADYLLLPSRIESIPVVFSDALQLHTPVIATPVGDLPRLFEKHEAGVMAANANAKDFATAIQSALGRDVEAFKTAVHLARQDFDLPAIAEGLVEDLGLSPS